ncbi:MAG: hypothetical protein R2736_21880 [Solirubrobacterales bacterium]
MSVIPKRKPKSKKARALQKAGKTAGKVTVVTKAPKAAASAWSGKRSGKVIKGALVAVVGLVTLKAVRSKLKGGAEPAPPPPQSYRATTTPASSQQTGATPDRPTPPTSSAGHGAGDGRHGRLVGVERAAGESRRRTEPAPDPSQSATRLTATRPPGES